LEDLSQMTNDLRTQKELSPSYKSRLPRRETERHRRAYLYYLNLGEQRTHKKVAEYFKCSLSSVKAWSSRFAWRNRVSKQAQAEKNELILEKRGEILEIRKALVTLAKLLIENAVKRTLPIEKSLHEAVDTEAIQIRTPRDLKDVLGVLVSAISGDFAAASLDPQPEEKVEQQGYRIVIE
jgi:transposase